MDSLESLAGALTTTIGNGAILTRLAIAALLGALLGMDREWRDKPAGLKTHMLVAMGAATFAILALELFQTALAEDQDARPDPVRIVEAMVKGAAFLGAGAIIQARGGIEGLTTGASVWLAGAIGLAAGIGQIGIAVFATTIGLGILIIIHYLEHWVIFPLRARHNDEDREDEGEKDRKARERDDDSPL